MPNMNSILMKSLGVLLALAIVLPLSVAVEAADSYPSRPVRFINPFPPGGALDVTGRIIATKLTERLGKQVLLETHSGGGGVLGAELVAKSAPDGYTLLLVSASYGTNPAFYKLPFNPQKDLVPVARVGHCPFVLLVNPNVPAKSVQEFIALAKKQPGKLICAAGGSGSSTHLYSELFKTMAGIDMKIVQFKGVGLANIDVMGGHSHMLFASLVSMIPHIKSGKLKALGVTEKNRSPALPDVPTISESGVPGYEAYQWYGILAPAGTPKAVIDRLNKELSVVMNSVDVKKIYETQGSETELMGPGEFGEFIRTDIARWVKVVKEAKIKTEH